MRRGFLPFSKVKWDGAAPGPRADRSSDNRHREAAAEKRTSTVRNGAFLYLIPGSRGAPPAWAASS